jgi:L-asparaginase II
MSIFTKTDAESNPCLACDEEQCGTAFKACAGATRRNCGIVTDIVRKPEEFCRVAEWND